jgi:hypothetical protein
MDDEWRFENENGKILAFGIAILDWDIIWIHEPYEIKQPGVQLKS